MIYYFNLVIWAIIINSFPFLSIDLMTFGDLSWQNQSIYRDYFINISLTIWERLWQYSIPLFFNFISVSLKSYKGHRPLIIIVYLRSKVYKVLDFELHRALRGQLLIFFILEQGLKTYMVSHHQWSFPDNSEYVTSTPHDLSTRVILRTKYGWTVLSSAPILANTGTLYNAWIIHILIEHRIEIPVLRTMAKLFLHIFLFLTCLFFLSYKIWMRT